MPIKKEEYIGVSVVSVVLTSKSSHIPCLAMDYGNYASSVAFNCKTVQMFLLLQNNTPSVIFRTIGRTSP